MVKIELDQFSSKEVVVSLKKKLPWKALAQGLTPVKSGDGQISLIGSTHAMLVPKEVQLAYVRWEIARNNPPFIQNNGKGTGRARNFNRSAQKK